MNDSALKRASTSGGAIAYRDEGEGPVVVLLHGFPTSSFLWRREIPLLASRMRVIAPDLLGYGESDRPEGVDLAEVAQAAYVRELLDRLGVEEVAVVGHDIGGAIGQLLALDPDGPAVRALVLIDSACFDAWPIEGVRKLQATPPEQQTAEFVEDVVRLVYEVGVAHEARREPAALAGYLDPWRSDPASFFRAARGIEGKGLAGTEDELMKLDVPAFLVWGEDDPYIGPDLAERLQETLPGSALALLPGCSHFVMEDAPRTVGPLIYEFLRMRYMGEPHRRGDE
jgi:pimeloyl-ACP methyl ester carboxylesterase